jgi:hypothetical protein
MRLKQCSDSADYVTGAQMRCCEFATWTVIYFTNDGRVQQGSASKVTSLVLAEMKLSGLKGADKFN